jgi:NitT/TauT family transport system substrate-binding protein
MRLLTTLILLPSLLLAWGCTPEPPAPLRVGTNIWPGYEPLYLARDLGYLDGSPTKLVEYPSATEAMRGYRNGLLEAVALTLDEVLLLADAGMAPRVVLVMDISNGGDVVLGRPGIACVEDLRGRKVGVENTALGAYVLSRALELGGLSPGDVEVVSLGVHEHERAFTGGAVDAVVTFEPVRSRLLAAGAEQVFDSSMIPGEVVDVLAVRPDVLAARGEDIDALIGAWFRAIEYLQREPDDATRRMAVREQLSPEAFRQSLAGLVIPTRERNLELLAGDAPELAATAARLAMLMRERGLLVRPAQIEGLLAPDHLGGSDG